MKTEVGLRGLIQAFVTVLMCVGLAGCSKYVTMYKILHEPTPTAWQNPLPDTPEVTATGEAVFQLHCARCHGKEGKGDGPRSWHLNPKPADLSKKHHIEGEIYRFVTNGKTQTGMPAFGGSLSVEERASVVRFIQKLAVAAPGRQSSALPSRR